MQNSSLNTKQLRLLNMICKLENLSFVKRWYLTRNLTIETVEMPLLTASIVRFYFSYSLNSLLYILAEGILYTGSTEDLC